MRKALLALLPLLAALGCGNYSNEDIAFLDALPDRSALGVRFPSQANALQSGEASLHQLTVSWAQQANAMADLFLVLIDKIRLLPPSRRTPDSRIWGPADDDKDKRFENQFVLTRVGDHFEYAVGQRRKGSGAEFVPVITGTFFTRSAHKGHGTIAFDNTAFEKIGRTPEDPNLSRVDLVYANDTSPRTVNTTVNGRDKDHGQPVTISWEYAENPDHSGRVVFDLLEDFDPAAANGTEHVHAISRWLASGAGRSDAILDQGGVAATCGDAAVDRVEQCWDARFAETYFDDTLEGCLFSPTPGIFCSQAGRNCPDGEAGSCVLPAENP